MEFCLSHTSPPEFDKEMCTLFYHWCNGMSVRKLCEGPHFKSFQANIEMKHPLIFPQFDWKDSIAKDTHNITNMSKGKQNQVVSNSLSDAYRLFDVLKGYLQSPCLLAEQTVVHVPEAKRGYCIDTYWSLDNALLTEILSNKRLASRSRKDLDDVADSTRIPLRSVLRQFNNLKRMYAAVDEEEEEDFNLFQFVREKFALNHQLCKKYAAIMFLFYGRFNLTGLTNHRRYRIRGTNFVNCAALTLACVVSTKNLFYNICEQELGTVVKKDNDLGGNKDNDNDKESNLDSDHRLEDSTKLEGLPSPRYINQSPSPGNPVFNSSGSEEIAHVRPPMPNPLPLCEQVVESPMAGNTERTSSMGEGSVTSGAAAASTSDLLQPPAPASDPTSNPVSRKETMASEDSLEPLSPKGNTATTISKGLRVDSQDEYDTPVDPSCLIHKDSASDYMVNPPVSIHVEDGVSDAILGGDNDKCWQVIWAVFYEVPFFDPDKGLLNNLRDIRNTMTGDVLDAGLRYVRAALNERPECKRINSVVDREKMRSTVKALMLIGSNLSQAREYRDYFEDILDKVTDPLQELGLTTEEVHMFLICCNTLTVALPSNKRMYQVTQGKRKDWIRFVLCCRLIFREFAE